MLRRQEIGESPLRILSSNSRQFLANCLDSRKILLTKSGLHRDWRGLAELAALNVGSISNGKISPTEYSLHLWGQKDATISQLWSHLETIDRFDVIDDSVPMIESDFERIQSQGILALAPPNHDQIANHVSVVDTNILTVDDQQNINSGLGLQFYDALVLFAEEDIDFVQTMAEKLEGEYGMKLCLKDRDLIGGLQFESESVVRLITERCNRVIVVLSPEFLTSNANTYFTHFAHALSLDQRRRIVIPCMLRWCKKPAVISFSHSLDYSRAQGLWDFWEKLRDSVRRIEDRNEFQAMSLESHQVPALTNVKISSMKANTKEKLKEKDRQKEGKKKDKEKKKQALLDYELPLLPDVPNLSMVNTSCSTAALMPEEKQSATVRSRFIGRLLKGKKKKEKILSP